MLFALMEYSIVLVFLRDSSSTDEEEEDDASEFNTFAYRRNVHKSISAHAKLGISLKKHPKNSFAYDGKNIDKVLIFKKNNFSLG